VNTLHDQEDGPRLLAQQAGGLAFTNNDYGLALGKAIADQEGYYVLGYQPDASTFRRTTDNKLEFHRIKVRVKKSGLQVRSRSGDKSKPPSARTRSTTLSQV